MENIVGKRMAIEMEVRIIVVDRVRMFRVYQGFGFSVAVDMLVLGVTRVKWVAFISKTFFLMLGLLDCRQMVLSTIETKT